MPQRLLDPLAQSRVAFERKHRQRGQRVTRTVGSPIRTGLEPGGQRADQIHVIAASHQSPRHAQFGRITPLISILRRRGSGLRTFFFAGVERRG